MKIHILLQMHTNDSILIDAALSSIPSNVKNASKVCVHTAQWCWEKSQVATSGANSLVYQTQMLIDTTPANYAYFLYDNLYYLTAQKEWVYDATAQKIYYTKKVL